MMEKPYEANQTYIFCMDLTETTQECYTISLDIYEGRKIMFDKFCRSYGSWHLP